MRSEVQVLPGPPPPSGAGGSRDGAIAQLGERVLCKHEVVGSIPSGSTKVWASRSRRRVEQIEAFLSFPMQSISFVERASVERDEGRLAGEEDSVLRRSFRSSISDIVKRKRIRSKA